MGEPSIEEAVPLSEAGETDVRRDLVGRILRSPSFQRSERLSRFLEYVCECQMNGRTDEINEQLIGCNVFGRPSGYNTAEDNIVRTHARLLRQKLEIYFQQEGRGEELSIHIPRGGYVPVFESRLTPPELTPPELSFAEQHVAPAEVPLDIPATGGTGTRLPWRYIAAGLSVGFVMGGALCWLLLWHRHVELTQSAPASHLLWSTLFSTKRPTLIVAGDAGVVMYQNLAKTDITVDEYAYRTYEKSPYAQTPPGYKWFPLALRTYTAYSEIELITYLTQLPEARGVSVRVVFARDLQAGDLQHNNIIFLGGPNYDPWEQLFESRLNFRMKSRASYDGADIENLSPQAGEASRYSYVEGDPSRRGYALVTLLGNLSGDGHVLLVQGTTALGDGMAGDFLKQGSDLAQVLGPAKTKQGLRDFEVLLSTTFAGTSWSHWRIEAERVR